MRVWLFYDDRYKYSRAATDNGYIDAWTNDETTAELRMSLFKDKGDIVEVDIPTDEFLTSFSVNNSDKMLQVYDLDADNLYTHPIEVVLTYTEYNELSTFPEEYLIDRSWIGVPSGIFKGEWSAALEALGMDLAYTTVHDYLREKFTATSFADKRGLLFDDYGLMYTEMDTICPITFNIFILRFGRWLRKDVLSDMNKFINKEDNRRDYDE